MKRQGWNAKRRNRNIGTAKAGHGQDNRLVIFDGLLEEVLPTPEPDPDLEAYLQELRSPLRVEHPRFGTLSFDRRISCFATTATWNQTSVELRLFVDEPGEHADACATAEALWADEKSWSERITRLSVDRLSR